MIKGIVTKIAGLLATAGLLSAFTAGGGVQAQSLPITFHDTGFAYNQQWSNLGTVTATWTVTSETATTMTIQGDINYHGQKWPFSGTATKMAYQPITTFMDSTMGGPDNLMFSVSPNGHHLWASNSNVAFTLANPGVTYAKEKALLHKEMTEAGLAGTPANSSATPTASTNQATSPQTVVGGGGNCTPDPSNNWIDGQGWSDCAEVSEPALLAQMIGNPTMTPGQSFLFDFRVWWANSYATNQNSGFSITQVKMQGATNASEVYENQIYPNFSGGGGTVNVSLAYAGLSVGYTFPTSGTSDLSNATTWTVDESGSWSPASEEFSSLSTHNGIDSKVSLYANNDAATGWHTASATANLQYYFPFSSYWIGATQFDWTYYVQ